MQVLTPNDCFQVGLAVGDIAKIRKSADLALIKLDLEVITDLQGYRFPMWMRKRLYRPSLVIQIDKKSGYFKRVKIMEVMFIILCIYLPCCEVGSFVNNSFYANIIPYIYCITAHIRNRILRLILVSNLYYASKTWLSKLHST